MHHQSFFRRLLALGTALLFSVSLVTGTASAEYITLTGTPTANVEYGESAGVNAGTIRYVNQMESSAYFYAAYWNEYVGEAHEQCGTSCMSMALSYIGVDALPWVLADLWGADGGSFGAHFYTPPAGVSVCYGDFYQEVQNYLTGNGKYSPIIIHLDSYSEQGHFVLVSGQLSENVYQVVDPASSNIWELTVLQNEDGTFTLSYTKNGAAITETTTASAMRCIQYYNPDTQIHETSFYDVYNDWMEEAVNTVTAAGLFSGATDNTFEPYRAMTRQEAAVVLYRLAGSPEIDVSTLSFSDALTGDAFTAALEWAVQTGVMTVNEEGLVYPSDVLSRQDFLTMLYRYEVKVAGNSTREYLVALNAYCDRNELNSYAILSVQWAVGSGLITSTSSEELLLSPRGELSRGAAAVILQNYLYNHGLS